jgi:hypothetical protein
MCVALLARPAPPPPPTHSLRAEAAAALRESAPRLAAAEARASQQAGQLVALRAELAARPTAAEQR